MEDFKGVCNNKNGQYFHTAAQIDLSTYLMGLEVRCFRCQSAVGPLIQNSDPTAAMVRSRAVFPLLFQKQIKNRNETGSNLSLSTRLTVLSKRPGRKRCCDATPDRCLGGVPSHYLRFAL